ncbi:MAG: hypothetical protein JWN86_1747 [Planctomycetota bacterium]|nr:hypothetical protein [Planctomycetota bacterium]
MSVDLRSSTVAATVAWQWKSRVDDVCERFEDAWRNGEDPKLEAYLNDPAVSPARRAALLSELLKLERELRQNRGETPVAAEYIARFPSYAVVVRSIFGEDRVGDYDLIAAIGEGGMGVVYHARHRKIGREVALKMIRPHFLDDASAIERFRLEAQLAARLEHEHIVTVYEAGQADGHHYYAMRYIVGQSLSEVIGKKPMDEYRAAGYLEQVARAVDFAHTHDVLHRDLKPRNILIDARDRAVVTDFGLAKILSLGTGATRSDDRLGTPPYMSPEQVRDPSRAGVASDVYSLGASLYEALTGRAPFLAENPLEIYRQILDVEPLSPRSMNKRCGRDLETICLKCLEKDPGRRYASALQLADDLGRFRARVPILARRVGPVERLRKLTRRHPTAAALVAVTAVAALAIAGVVQSRRSKAIVGQSEARARAAIDLIFQFGETRLNDRPDLQKELLENLLRYYEGFLTQRGDDPELADDIAATFTRVAQLNDALGFRPAALKAHQHALELHRRLVDRYPEDRQRRSKLAGTLHDLGVLHREIGHRDSAIVAYQEALAIREALVESDRSCRAFLHDDPPPVLSHRDRALIGDLARSHGYIGDWEREGGRRDEAARSYEKAHTLRAKLAANDPADLLAKYQLARSENNAGIFHREGNRPNDANASHSRAAELQQELVAVGPVEAKARLAATFLASGRLPDVEYDDFRSDQAASQNYLGVLLASSGLYDEALGMHVAAAEKYDALASEHPGLTRWDADRAWTATYLGELRNSTDDLEVGRVLFEKLLAADPSVTLLRAGMARNEYARGVVAEGLGREAEADALWELARTRRAEARVVWESARKVQEQLLTEQPRNFDFRLDLERTRAALAAIKP